MPYVTLPPHQWADLHKIQRGMLREIAEALATLDAGLSGDLKKAIIRLDRLGWDRGRIRVEVERVLSKYAKIADKTHIYLIRQAERHADEYIERLKHFAVPGRTLEPIQASKVAFWTTPGAGRGSADAVIAYTRGMPLGTGAKTIAEARKMRHVLKLSHNLHPYGPQSIELITQRVTTAIREAQSLDFASRELVSRWGKLGVSPIGKGAADPTIIQMMRNKIDDLGKITGKDLKDTLADLRAHLPRLKQGGRMRLAYAELISDLEKGKAAESALKKWGHQQERQAAERIIFTETQRGFRMAQIEHSGQMPGLIGYRWRMNRSKHARFKRSKPGKFSMARAMRSTHGGKVKAGRLAGRHCICEAMDGQIISVEDYRTEWSAGGHPNCACFFEEVFDRDKMFSAPETSGEKTFLDAAGF